MSIGPLPYRITLWIAGFVFLCMSIWALQLAREHSAEKKSTQDAPHSNATRLEKSASRSRLIEANPNESRISSKDNAATYYRQAFALAEKLTKEEKDMMKYRNVLNNEPSAVDVEALLDKIDPIIALLRQGAGRSDCDWGLRDLHALTTAPHMFKAWELAQITLWDAKQRAQDQPDRSVDDMRALSQLSNSIQAGAGSSVVHLGTQGLISQFIKDCAAELPPQNRQELLSMWIQPDFLRTAQACNRSEIEVNIQFINLVESGVDFDGKPLSEFVKSMASNLYGGDPATMAKTAKGYKKIATVAEESVFWPDEKFEQWCRQVTDMPVLKDGSSPIQVFVGIHSDLRKALTSQAMTAAGLALMDGGETALSRFQDPFTGQPFSYKVVDENGSFELQSTVAANKGKPQTMIFKIPAH